MSTALEIIEALSAAGYEPDFKLTAGSGPTRVEFPVHRLLLASVSSVFACSAGRKRESKEEGDEFYLTEPPETVRVLLSWIYRQSGFSVSKLTPREVDSLLFLTDKYEIPSLRADLVAHLDLHVRPADFQPIEDKQKLWELYYIAVRHGIEPLASRLDETVLSLSPDAYDSTLSAIEASDPRAALRIERVKRRAETRRANEAVLNASRAEKRAEDAEQRIVSARKVLVKSPERADYAVLLAKLEKKFYVARYE